MILTTGAAGALGRLVTARLTAAGTEVVAGSRTPEQLTAATTRHLDFDEPSTLRPGFAGVDVLVMISAGYAEDDVVTARYRAVVAAAEAAGVRQVVYTSLAGAADHLSICLPHRLAERLLAASSMDVTVLRNGLYAEVMEPFAAMTVAGGQFTAPMGDSGLAMVARADLAEVAATVALEADADPANPHRGRTYELVGTRALGGEDIAAALSHDGRQVVYRPSGLADLREPLAAAGLRPFEIAHTISMFSNISAGFLSGTETDLTRLLPGEPRSAAAVLAGIRD